jgi:hypothetical protein
MATGADEGMEVVTAAWVQGGWEALGIHLPHWAMNRLQPVALETGMWHYQHRTVNEG